MAAIRTMGSHQHVTGESLQSPWAYGLLLACLAWMALVFAPALFASAGWPHADALRWLFHPVCHQIPGRSFHVLGEPLAACARCTGLYLGFTLGVAAWPRLPNLATRLAKRPRWILVFMVPLAVDVTFESAAVVRFATGVVAAFPCGLLPLLAIAELQATQTQSGGDPP